METVIDFEKIESEVKECLDSVGATYKPKVITKLVNDWFEAKKGLIEKLEKNPDWNPESLAIVSKDKKTRDADMTKADKALRAMRGEAARWIAAKCEDLEDRFVEMEKQFSGFDGIGLKAIVETRAINAMNNVFKYTSNAIVRADGHIRPEEKEYLNEKFDFLKCRVGQKKTKVSRKIFERYGLPNMPDFEKLYAVFADELSPMKAEITACLSVHPCDYLMMSNGNSWTSCHRIGTGVSGGGCYEAGTLSYMLDPSSILYCEVESEKTEVWRQKKIERCMFFLSEHGTQFYRSRIYPKDVSDDAGDRLRDFFIKAISPSLEEGEKFCENDSIRNTIFEVEGYRHYRDYWMGYGLGYLMKGKKAERMQVGAEVYCLTCGKRRVMESGYLVCQKCYHDM